MINIYMCTHMRECKPPLGHVSGHADVDACLHATNPTGRDRQREKGMTKETKYHMRPAHL